MRIRTAAAIAAALSTLALPRPAAAADERGGGQGQDYWGATASGFSTYLGQSFRARSAVFANGGFWSSPFDAGDISWPGPSGESVFEVQLTDIPNGAVLEAVRWWAHDATNSGDLHFSVLQVCQPDAGAGPAVTNVLGSQSTAGAGGDTSGEMTMSAVADTRACAYRVRAQFGVPTPTAPFLSVYKVRAQWVRQVSPAPATARFVDVPVGHPFHRFVEALASSGITGGCAADQYCPDAPLTRGQMAVFLATALGLNWGGQ